MIKAFFSLLAVLMAFGSSFATNEPQISRDQLNQKNEVHPFHISVTEIVHKPEDKVIQMTVRLFLDDMEQGLREFTSNQDLDIFNKADLEYLNENIGKYVLENLALTTKKELELNYLGFEYDNDVLYCYIESVKVKPFDQLTLTNTLLTTTFDDQENLVHVKKGGKVKSLRMSRTNDRDTLEWDTKK